MPVGLGSDYWARPRGGAGRWWRTGLGGCAPASAAPSALVQAIACAIAQVEGPNPLLDPTNNPGRLRAGPGQIGTSYGFAVFPDLATGWRALYARVQSGINAGQSLSTFFAGVPCNNPPGNTCGGYAPAADSNQPNVYAGIVGSQVGVSTGVPLAQLQAAYDGGSTLPPSSGDQAAGDAFTGLSVDTGWSMLPIVEDFGALSAADPLTLAVGAVLAVSVLWAVTR